MKYQAEIENIENDLILCNEVSVDELFEMYTDQDFRMARLATILK